MNYKNLFNAILLEQELPGPSIQGDQTDAFSNSLDDGTDPDAFATRGMQEIFSQVQNNFNNKMQAFGDALTPEAVKNMTLGRLKDEVSKVFKYINGIQVYSKSKIDTLAQNPSAILAGFIASDPSKQAAFNDLHAKLEEFSSAIEETETQISTLKGKIDEFMEDVNQNQEQDVSAQPSQSPQRNPANRKAKGPF